MASFPLLAIGVGLLLRSELGGAPFDVLNTGIAETLDVPLFVGFAVAAVTCIVVGWRLGGVPGPMTYFLAGVLGPLINLAHAAIPDVDVLAVRIPMFGVGLLIVAFGVALQVVAAFGAGPGEVVMLGLVHRGLSVRVARWLLDGLVLAIGIALGGAFGVGTAITLVVFAPLLAWFLRRLGFVADAAPAHEIVSVGPLGVGAATMVP